ncbi:hypothetical protein [Glaciibacter psychrotolerans]|uniref:Uncharacterized protein n=1 Tax=Glaciibacter psychrotolerans TaxID=670054 RepID=A0A7Z0EGP9_9MICO|nr:hypothetical protein [Leifsonia psychrotolerans]NYJ21339.1 hypothetical protein [Leifsonia psychrotolerans]
MLTDLAFFSFVELADAAQHDAYNRWHQLDHRPENLALPGVAWGDRWARAATTGLAEPGGEFAGTDYVAMYWFRSPVAESVAAWDRLGEASFQWGRGPIIPGVERTLLAFFRPVKGYSAPRVLVDPDVLPYRPNRGIHVTLTRYPEAHGAETHRCFGWEDARLIPALVAVPGVAGAWTFSFSHSQQHTTLPFDGSRTEQPGGLRIRLLYLDGDPVETGEAIRRVENETAAHPDAPQEAGDVLFSSSMRTIIPWQDW